MSRVDDYLLRQKLARRQDFDQWVHHALAVDVEYSRSLGMKINPLRGDIRYVVTFADRGSEITIEYLSFARAYQSYVRGAPRQYDGAHLVH